MSDLLYCEPEEWLRLPLTERRFILQHELFTMNFDIFEWVPGEPVV